MAFESILVSLDGAEAPDLYADLVALEVELADDAPATARLVLGMGHRPDGSWAYVDDERVRVWAPLAVEVGFVEGGREEVFAGYVTSVTPTFDPDATQSTLEVVGLDNSVRMDREEVLKAWPNKTDGDIAREVLQTHGFTPRVEPTEVVHDEAVSTVVQRETDAQFLRRLARRNGFACYVEGETAYFGPVPADAEPQPVLAAHFGDETTLVRFAATVDGLRPAGVAMFQVDRLAKEVLAADVAASDEDPLGGVGAAALPLAPAVPAGRVVVAKNAATGLPEMEALCRGLVREGAWFVHAEATVDAAAYAHVLRPRRLVTVKGVGATHSGVYYVASVRHTITPEGYVQAVRLQRDALRPAGTETFTSGDGLGLV